MKDRCIMAKSMSVSRRHLMIDSSLKQCDSISQQQNSGNLPACFGTSSHRMSPSSREVKPRKKDEKNNC